MPSITLSGVNVVAAADIIAPILTLPTASPTGATTANGGVTTDEDNGTLYWLASANASESVAAVKAGSSQSVSATGVQSVSVTGLTGGQSYYLHFVHTDQAGNDSAVSTSTQFTTSSNVLTLTGINVVAQTAQINSVSSGVAGATVNIVTDGAIDLTTATTITATYGGIALTGISALNTTTIEATLPASGLLLGQSHDLVITVDGNSSAPYGLVYAAPLGGFVVLTAPYAQIHQDSPLKNAAYSDLVAGDVVEYDSTTSPGGYAVSMSGNGLVTVAGASGQGAQNVTFAVWDASDSYHRSVEREWFFSQGAVDLAPVVTAPSNISLEFVNGGAGLAHNDAALLAWLALVTATDNEDGALTPTSNIGTLPDPITAGVYTITFSATDSENQTRTATAQLTVTEAAPIADNQAPIFTEGLTSSNITTTSFSVGFTLDENCTVYLLTVPQGSTVPTPAQIKAGVDYGSVTILDAQNKAVTGGQADSIAISGLSAGQQVTTYAAAEDAVPNLQGAVAVRSLTVTLLATNNPPASSGDYPQQSATVGQLFSFNGAANFSDTDALTYSLSGLSGATINANTGAISWTPSAGGDVNGTVTATDTAGQSVSASLPIRVIAADSFWSFVPGGDRILNMDASPLVDQDKNASLNYWLNFGFVVSPLTISSFTIDPDNELPQDKPAITGVGVNTAELTDSDGNTYPVGTVVGITVSGGALEEVYHTVVRFVMNSGESDDRTLSIRVVDK